MTADNKQTMHEVIQADRDAAADFTQDAAQCDPNKSFLVAIRAGELDHTPVVQAFAAHRIAAEQSRDDVIEECAKVAEGHRYDDSFLNSCGMRREHRHDLAQAIRAMKGSKT